MKITYKTINTYLQENKSSNICKHTNRNIKKDDFEEIGNLYDGSYGYLTYLAFGTKNKQEAFTGSYPLHGCSVLKCKECGQIVFFHLNHGGVAPRPEYILADYNKEYLMEPASKSISFSKDRLVNFRDNFFFVELFEPVDVIKATSFVTIDKEIRYIFNYRESENKNKKITVHLDIIGEREFLRRMHNWFMDGVKNNKNPTSDSGD